MAELKEPAPALAELLRARALPGLEPSVAAGVRRRLLARATPSPRARRSPWLWAGVAFAVLSVVLAVLVSRPAPLTFAVDGEPAGAAHAWLGDDDDETTLSFSDGTRVTIARAARARVADTSPDGARVLLERGSLDAEVVHSAAARWSFLAGPFEIAVTGTRFVAAWDPEGERLELSMTEGSVLVSGPVLGAARSVRGGERLTVSLREQRVVLATIAADPEPASPTSAPEARPTVAIGPSQQPKAEGPSTPAGSAHAPPPTAAQVPTHLGARPNAPAWLALAHEGKHKEAMAALDDAGFAAALKGPAAVLIELADSARLGGRPQRAQQALVAVRTRHGVSGVTAFLLGQIAADQLKSPAEAARWFETYLAEQPRGTMAEPALGRLLELAAGGAAPAARAAASRYLDAFPSGPRAALARSLLERP